LKACTIVAGVSGSGKTAFALRYLVAEHDFTCRFIFDSEPSERNPTEGDYADRLGLVAAENFNECQAAIEDGFVLFDPHTLYPGRIQQAFDDWCAWVFDVAATLPGRKAIVAEEVWKHCDRLSIPESLAKVAQTGRKRGLEPIFLTQLPHKLNGSILNEWTELVCFTLDEEKALDCIQDRGAPRDEVRELPLGSFIALNRHTRGLLRGRLF
jgi:hypothetical protein